MYRTFLLMFKKVSNWLDTNISADAEDEEPTDQEIRESLNEYSFFDKATIYTRRAGSGGQGSSTYKKGPGMSNIKF